MIAKKSSKADLERKRFAFFQIGLLIAGSVTLLAFEYSSASAEEKKVVVTNDGPSAVVFDPDVYEDVVQEKPEPQERQQSTVITMPVDDITVVNKKMNANVVYTTHIVVTDPCLDCKEIGGGIEDEDETLWVSEVDPEFVGGYKKMMEFIQNNVNYPELQREMGIEGVVNVQFVVNKDGSISNVTTDGSMNKELEKEARRVISMMPNWKPGEQAGKPVSVRYTVPINFVIKKQ